MKRWPFLFGILAGSLSLSAQAEVKQSAADSFQIAYVLPVKSTPAKAYASIVAISQWWSSEHTWSGKAANLSLKAEAGGCFCERWSGGSAEHGRVIMALPDTLLRLDTVLGPLQELALKGILSFSIRSNDDGATEIAVEYRVNGSGSSGLDVLAPQVDEVLGVQVARLQRFADGGNPDEPSAPSAPSAAAAAPAGNIDADILAEWAKQAAAQVQTQSSAQGRKATTPPKTAKPKAAAPKPASPPPTDGP